MVAGADSFVFAPESLVDAPDPNLLQVIEQLIEQVKELIADLHDPFPGGHPWADLLAQLHDYVATTGLDPAADLPFCDLPAVRRAEWERIARRRARDEARQR